MEPTLIASNIGFTPIPKTKKPNTDCIRHYSTIMVEVTGVEPASKQESLIRNHSFFHVYSEL